MRRSRIRRKGYDDLTPRKQQARDAELVFRLTLQDRAWCEASGIRDEPGDLVCGFKSAGNGRAHFGTDAHHVWPEDRDRGVHDPDRGKWLCRRAHEWVHAHPVDAARVGLLRPVDPEG